jgi:hypothetical protein
MNFAIIINKTISHWIKVLYQTDTVQTLGQLFLFDPVVVCKHLNRLTLSRIFVMSETR